MPRGVLYSPEEDQIISCVDYETANLPLSVRNKRFIDTVRRRYILSEINVERPPLGLLRRRSFLRNRTTEERIRANVDLMNRTLQEMDQDSDDDLSSLSSSSTEIEFVSSSSSSSSTSVPEPKKQKIALNIDNCITMEQAERLEVKLQNDLKKIQDKKKALEKYNNTLPSCPLCCEEECNLVVITQCNHVFCNQCHIRNLSRVLPTYQQRCHRCPLCTQELDKPNEQILMDYKATIADCNKKIAERTEFTL